MTDQALAESPALLYFDALSYSVRGMVVKPENSKGREPRAEKADADWRDLRLSALVDDLAVSLVFLTRVPMRVDNARFQRRPLAKAMRAFPLIGAGLGVLAGLAFILGEASGLPGLAAGSLAVAVMVLTTGALHEDALADMADGFGGGRDVDHKLSIMKDSRVGTYGAVAAALALLMKVSAIVGLDEAGGSGLVLVCLIASGAVSRTGVVILPHLLAPAKDQGLAAETGRPGEVTVVQAMLAAAVITFLLVSALPAFVGLVLALGAVATLGNLAARQIGGQTGDVLGASQQAAEIAFLYGVLMIV